MVVSVEDVHNISRSEREVVDAYCSYIDTILRKEYSRGGDPIHVPAPEDTYFRLVMIEEISSRYSAAG